MVLVLPKIVQWCHPTLPNNNTFYHAMLLSSMTTTSQFCLPVTLTDCVKMDKHITILFYQLLALQIYFSLPKKHGAFLTVHHQRQIQKLEVCIKVIFKKHIAINTAMKVNQKQCLLILTYILMCVRNHTNETINRHVINK